MYSREELDKLLTTCSHQLRRDVPTELEYCRSKLVRSNNVYLLHWRKRDRLILFCRPDRSHIIIEDCFQLGIKLVDVPFAEGLLKRQIRMQHL